MQEATDPRQLLANIAKILKDLKISYIVTGGIAVLLWGRPRFTADIDIVIELSTNDLNKLQIALKGLGKTGYIDKKTMDDAVRNRGEFNFIHGNTGVKVDFWVMQNTAFDLSRMRRKVYRTILGEKISFSSPEDLILIKLFWAKESLSTRQLEDAESIMQISRKKLDKRYLMLWSKKLGVAKILNKII